MRAPAVSTKRKFVRSEELDCPVACAHRQSRHFLQSERGKS
jgi:hypothetical protein